MKTTILILLLLCTLTSAGQAQWGSWPNEVGLYTVEEPRYLWETWEIFSFEPGLYTIYLVISNPVNENTGATISTLGGFELSLDIGDGWQINDVDLPPNVLDFNNLPEHFYCSGVIPASGRFTTLATITLLTFEAPPAWIYMSPYAVGRPSIPGNMAITDADDDFSLSAAFPVSGNYDLPVFGLNTTNSPVPTRSATWGELKSLYR